MLGDLYRSGFDITDNAEDADVIVVNTCGFIEDAKSESLDVWVLFFWCPHWCAACIPAACTPHTPAPYTIYLPCIHSAPASYTHGLHTP